MGEDRYSCAEVFQRLDDFLDRELAPDEVELVRKHLEICLQCALEARFESLLLDGLRSRLQHIQIPTDLAARVHERLERSRNPGS